MFILIVKISTIILNSKSLERVMKNTDWISKAACKDLETKIFFPSQGEVVNRLAVEACDNCPVKAQCLSHALHHEGYGYWGGTTEKERKRIRKQLNIRLDSPSTGLGNYGAPAKTGRIRGVHPGHGTVKGYNFEQRQGQGICDSCKLARKKYGQDLYKKNKEKVNA